MKHLINETEEYLFIESRVLSSLGKATKSCKLKGHIYVMRAVISLSTLQNRDLDP